MSITDSTKLGYKGPSMSKPGLTDVVSSFYLIKLPLYLAWADIRQRYRRSSLGPFWITISTGVMIGCIGLIFGNLFETPMSEFLPFLASGLILWSFISSTLNESTTVFSIAEPVIKQLPLPLFTHVLRLIAKNLYIFFHNTLILPIVFITVHKGINIELLWFISGLVLLLVNLMWISLVLGVICARFRDLTQIVQSVLQIFFYVTPIIWMPGLLARRTSAMILEPNLFYHLIEIVRAPILGHSPTFLNCAVSASVAVVGSLFALIVFNRYRGKIAYWL